MVASVSRTIVEVDRLRHFFRKINIREEPVYGTPLSRHTSFRIGGPADAFVRPGTAGEAAAILRGAAEEGIPVFFLGAGANILVGDRGIRGIVLSTERLRHAIASEGWLEAGAGLTVDELCLDALARGLSGLEAFAGMPGSVGGSVVMNARCYGTEFSDLLVSVESVRPDGGLRRRSIDPRDWSYKRSPFQQDGPAGGELVISARFRLVPGRPDLVAETMRSRRADRTAKGHYRLPSAGSMFRNDRRFGAPTGQLLDRLGLKGKRIGDALIAPWHANIFVYDPQPDSRSAGHPATDMRNLVDFASREARSRLGIELEPEVVFAGEFLETGGCGSIRPAGPEPFPAGG